MKKLYRNSIEMITLPGHFFFFFLLLFSGHSYGMPEFIRKMIEECEVYRMSNISLRMHQHEFCILAITLTAILLKNLSLSKVWLTKNKPCSFRNIKNSVGLLPAYKVKLIVLCTVLFCGKCWLLLHRLHCSNT